MQPILNIALRASRQASEYIIQTIDKNDPKPSESYANAKLLSHLEESLYQNFYDALKKANPAHFIVGLGETLEKTKDDSWHINQIHNPEHLLRKLPSCAYSILHKHHGKALNTLLVSPFSNLEFTGTRGSGAALNGRRIRCSSTKDLNQAVVATNVFKQFATCNTKHQISDFANELGSQVQQVLSGYCDALDIAMVASGQIDAAILTNVNFQEVESALLLCQEAGVLTGTFNGMPFSAKEDKIIVANPKLFKGLVQRLNGFQERI
ncbi:MAG: myo-inositol-1(or 4)-monophosphatase [Oleiphilaceae bacterium]|jgi:myo-inositol-1(or 4)-monophosphatase